MVELEEQANNKPERDSKGRLLPGNTANPNGRPKNTLKAFLAGKFREMSDEEKEQWLEDNKDRISPEFIWKMAEGNPSNETALKTEGTMRIISIDE